MKILILVAVVLVILLCARSYFLKPIQLSEVYLGLRNEAFKCKINSVNFPDLTPENRIGGVIIDLGLSQAPVTIATFVSGDASIYYPKGGGILGGIGKEAISSKAKHLSYEAEKYFKNFTKTEEYPLPENGEVIFYLLTENGVYKSLRNQGDILKEKDPMYDFFMLVNDIITEMRLMDEEFKKRENKSARR